jgi:hypothetical protein
MRRRSVFLVLFAVASLGLGACSQLTAPHFEGGEEADSTNCRSLPMGSIGFRCDTIL